MDHHNNFNLLRLLAAMEVVYVHCIEHLGLPYGWEYHVITQFPGVPCFFIVSGFLITGSFFNSTISSFFVKRALRIYPALIVNILTLELAVVWTGCASILFLGQYFGIYLPVYLSTASTIFAQHVVALVNPSQVVNFYGGFFKFYPSGVLWTLTVELTFYLVLPALLFVVRLSRSFGITLIAFAMMLSLLASMTLPESFNGQHQLLDVTVARYFWIFGLGVIANLYWVNIRQLFEGKFLFWIIAYAVTCIVFHLTANRDFFTSPTSPEEPFKMVVLAGALLSAAYTAPLTTRRLGLSRNDYSYGIYLWHVLVISILLGLGFKGEWWLWLVVYPAAFAIAAISWFTIERPVQRLKRRARQPVSVESVA